MENSPKEEIAKINEENCRQARIHVGIGDVYYRNEEYIKAEDEYDKAITFDYPLKGDIFLHRGKILMIFGKYELALRNFKRHLKICTPKNEEKTSKLISQCENEIKKRITKTSKL